MPLLSLEWRCWNTGGGLKGTRGSRLQTGGLQPTLHVKREVHGYFMRLCFSGFKSTKERRPPVFRFSLCQSIWMREGHGKTLNNGPDIRKCFHPIKRYFRSCVFYAVNYSRLYHWCDVSVYQISLGSFLFVSYMWGCFPFKLIHKAFSPFWWCVRIGKRGVIIGSFFLESILYL